MILALDVGNTNIVVGVYKGPELLADFRIATDRQKTADEYGMLLLQLLAFRGIPKDEIRGVIMSSVVPPVIATFERMTEKYFGCRPINVEPGIKTGIIIRYENPKEIGADRIVNAV
ncbi:MAG: type III pantothenate kinase, partial [Firmicutes bacterium]|nr:type III pantothenate kinase [Bacillota bacterium]